MEAALAADEFQNAQKHFAAKEAASSCTMEVLDVMAAELSPAALVEVARAHHSCTEVAAQGEGAPSVGIVAAVGEDATRRALRGYHEQKMQAAVAREDWHRDAAQTAVTCSTEDLEIMASALPSALEAAQGEGAMSDGIVVAIGVGTTRRALHDHHEGKMQTAVAVRGWHRDAAQMALKCLWQDLQILTKALPSTLVAELRSSKSRGLEVWGCPEDRRY